MTFDLETEDYEFGDEFGVSEEQDVEQMERYREYLDEGFGEDGP